MMKSLTHKDILLLSLIILSQLHAIYTGSTLRVDWYLCIKYTRRIDYAVLYICRYLIQIILAYCVLFPMGINRNIKLFIFILSIWDIIHYFTFSSIDYGQLKIIIAFISFLMYINYFKIIRYIKSTPKRMYDSIKKIKESIIHGYRYVLDKTIEYVKNR